jgi:hypothetical protein
VEFRRKAEDEEGGANKDKNTPKNHNILPKDPSEVGLMSNWIRPYHGLTLIGPALLRLIAGIIMKTGARKSFIRTSWWDY